MIRPEGLDPTAAQLLDLLARSGAPPPEELTPVEARAAFAGLVNLLGDGATVASVEHREIAGVPVVVNTPLGTGPFPVLVWIHGGGWVIGCAAEAQPMARDLAAAAGCIVVNVDYRLAPEAPFPAPVDDAVAVARWVIANAGDLGGDATRIAVGGDSAGGNLSAVVAQEVSGLVAQILVYPATDLTLAQPSIRENGVGLFLEQTTMQWFVDHYLGGHDPSAPRASPLFVEDAVLRAVPPALVITAEFDPLRDEGEAYASRLEAVGVEVTLHRYDGQIHGFATMPTLLPAGAAAVEEIGSTLRAAFGR